MYAAKHFVEDGASRILYTTYCFGGPERAISNKEECSCLIRGWLTTTYLTLWLRVTAYGTNITNPDPNRNPIRHNQPFY